jgi:hypothetical protein
MNSPQRLHEVRLRGLHLGAHAERWSPGERNNGTSVRRRRIYRTAKDLRFRDAIGREPETGDDP